MKLLKKPTIQNDGFSVDEMQGINERNYQKVVEETYGSFKPGRNAKNQLCRGTSWGAYQSDQFIWSNRTSYSLPKELQPEEGDAVRIFSEVPKEFLTHEITEAALRKAFRVWKFREDSYQALYQVQISAIRYEATIHQPALPSPIVAHQDLVDGTIIVLNKRGDLVGGLSRLFMLDGTPYMETELAVGEALSVKDDEWLHQVTPMMFEPKGSWKVGDTGVRDVLLVRFQKVGR